MDLLSAMDEALLGAERCGTLSILGICLQERSKSTILTGPRGCFFFFTAVDNAVIACQSYRMGDSSGFNEAMIVSKSRVQSVAKT